MKRMQEMESNASSERDEVCCYFYKSRLNSAKLVHFTSFCVQAKSLNANILALKLEIAKLKECLEEEETCKQQLEAQLSNMQDREGKLMLFCTKNPVNVAFVLKLLL